MTIFDVTKFRKALKWSDRPSGKGGKEGDAGEERGGRGRGGGGGGWGGGGGVFEYISLVTWVFRN